MTSVRSRGGEEGSRAVGEGFIKAVQTPRYYGHLDNTDSS